MNILKQLENAPRNLILYVLGLIGGVVDDYTLVTLTAFAALVGVIVGSILIGLAVFFGGYFVLRVVSNVAEVIGFHANRTAAAQEQVAQTNMQVAAAIAQFNVPNQAQGQVVDGDLLP
jgi:hypothetical protein